MNDKQVLRSIQSYWQGLGFDVTVTATAVRFRHDKGEYSEIRSNLVNGLPPGATSADVPPLEVIPVRDVDYRPEQSTGGRHGYRVKGKGYKSMAAAAAAHGMKASTVSTRLKAGWPIDDAFTIPTSKANSAKGQRDRHES